MKNLDSSMIGNATKNLARKFNTQMSRVRETRNLPDDDLAVTEANVRVLCHVGFPENADSVSYEPNQRLLAVGTKNGWVKVIGADGVEAFMSGSCEAGTVHLGFLKHRAVLLRVTQNGQVELYSVNDKKLLDSLNVGYDVITDVATVPGGPYLLVGCESGNCKVIHVQIRAGVEPVSPREGGTMESVLLLQPYQILKDDIEAAGKVVAIETTQNEDRPLALIVHQDSGAVVWDIRSERVIAAAVEDSNDPSKPTCACWVGARSNCFAVGYDDGSILVWGIPASTLKSSCAKSGGIQDAVLVLPLRVCPDDQTATAIKKMTFILGDKGTPYEKDCILTLGGQRRGEPEALSLLSLEPEGPDDVLSIPWFGNVIAHTLMVSGSSTAQANDGIAAGPAIMILTEGGQLIVHDLASWDPSPLSLKFQELPPITCTKFVASLDLDGIHVPSLKEMRYLSLNYVTDSRWPFHGGIPPGNYFNSEADYMSAGNNVAHPSAILACGHRDGRVRFWDATSEVPRYLITVPASAALLAEEGRIQAVACIDVCPVSGIMAVGHSGGLVRIYQFSKNPQAVRKVALDESLVPYDTLLEQPAGWQYVMRYSNHAKCITSLTLATKPGLLVVGDVSGSLSVVDLNIPRQISHAQVSSSVFKSCVAQVQQDFDDSNDSTLEEVVFVYTKDGALHTFNAFSGKLMAAKPLMPKNPSNPLDFCLLDANRNIIPPLSGRLFLPWADNDSVSRPRTLGMTHVTGFSQGRSLGEAAQDSSDEEDDALRSAVSEQAKRNMNIMNLFKKSQDKDNDVGEIDTSGELWGGIAKETTIKESPYPMGEDYQSYILNEGSSGTVSMIFMATSKHLRLYTIETILNCERFTEKKVKFEDEMLFAGSFNSLSGAGVITVSTGDISLHSLPSLTKLEDHFSEKVYLPHMSGESKAWCCSVDGQLLLRTSSNELLRYACLANMPSPAGPGEIYRRDLAARIHTDSKQDSAKSTVAPKPKNFAGILNSVKDAASAATGAVMQEFARDPSGKPLPSIQQIFQKEVSLLEDDIDSITDDDDDFIQTPVATTAKLAASESSTKKSSMSQSNLRSPGEIDIPNSSSVTSRRNQLLGSLPGRERKPKTAQSATSRPPPRGMPRRTASEIKRVYGHTKAQDARATMERNKELLAERGRKLANLEAQTAEMENDADNFASMAQELEKAFADRKWWQL
eukprot:jgi/Picsp_1/1357/NSC_04837-R1_transducin wd40 domain-containing protein